MVDSERQGHSLQPILNLVFRGVLNMAPETRSVGNLASGCCWRHFSVLLRPRVRRPSRNAARSAAASRFAVTRMLPTAVAMAVRGSAWGPGGGCGGGCSNSCTGGGGATYCCKRGPSTRGGVRRIKRQGRSSRAKRLARPFSGRRPSPCCPPIEAWTHLCQRKQSPKRQSRARQHTWRSCSSRCSEQERWFN